MDIVWAMVVVLLAAFLGGGILIYASQYMLEKEDPRREQILSILPGVNCGACGYVGCAAYANAIVDGASCSLCTPGGAGTAAQAEGIVAGKYCEP